MEIYYYCSYTGSPVGFQLGKLNTENGKLSSENIPLLIRRCFSQGMVRKACGWLLEEEKYFLLVKDLTAKGKESNEADEYYLNIALVSGQYNDYQKWLSDKTTEEQEISNSIRDTMSLRGDPRFGFTVHLDRIAALTEQSFGGLFAGISPKEEETYFQGLSPNLSERELIDILAIPSDDYDLKKLRPDTQREGTWFRLGKKKERRIHLEKILLISAAAAAVLVGLIKLFKAFGK